jgi:ketosteroid isomerase-like protein
MEMFRMSTQPDNIAIARRYLQAIEAGSTGAALAAFFTPDVVQEEFPNRLVAQGGRRDLNAMLEGAERGQRVVTRQRYDVRNALATGDQVALEVLWTATLAVPVGSLPPGGEMRAHFAVFLEFRDGKIAAQRNYDCFDPF